jgi:alkylhydroperoxidase family enzyme
MASALILLPNLRLEAKDIGTSKSFSAADVQAHEAEITGKPPRILPVPQAEIGKEAFESINSYRKKISLPPLTELPDILATLWRHPALYMPLEALTLQLARGELPMRARELALLRVGWLCQSPFVWGEHVKIAKREVKLTEEEVERVTAGSSAPGWNELDRAVLRAVEELFANAMISDETWSVLAKNLNEKQLIEFPILVSKYQGAAYLANSARIRLMAGNRGLAER